MCAKPGSDLLATEGVPDLQAASPRKNTARADLQKAAAHAEMVALHFRTWRKLPPEKRRTKTLLPFRANWLAKFYLASCTQARDQRRAGERGHAKAPLLQSTDEAALH